MAPIKPKMMKKLGVAAVCSLWIGLLVIVAALGYLWFLWLANDTNLTWKAITSNGWVSQSVVLTSLAIRQSVSFQSSVATAMIACLAIEKALVLLLNLASVSLTRNSNSGPLFLTWWLWKAFVFDPHRWKKFLLPVLVTVLLCTTLLIQLTSFALISDVDLGFIQGRPNQRSSPIYFHYDVNNTIPVLTYGSTWYQQPQAYVTFGEYHEPPSNTQIDGVDDTGMTMRAFLPITDAQSRSLVAEWDGIASVLDARVVCTRPRLADPRVHYAASQDALALTGTFYPGVEDTGKIGLIETFPADTSGHGTAFACMAPLTTSYNGAAGAGLGAQETQGAIFNGWRLSICQPTSSAYVLQSELQQPGVTGREGIPDTAYKYGTAYVMLNVSSGDNEAWNNVIPSEDASRGKLLGSGTAPLGYSVHGNHNEWYDMIFSQDTNLNLSATICYTAFDTADLNVKIHAATNHSDRNPQWNSNTRTLDYTLVRSQLGQSLTDGSVSYAASGDGPSSRAVMALTQRQSWIPQRNAGDYVAPSDRLTGASWIVDYANMAGSAQSRDYQNSLGDNYTVSMWQSLPIFNAWVGTMTINKADLSLASLVQEILSNGGPISFAMQSIVTILAQTAYYQQIQQMNGNSTFTTTDFTLVSAPVKIRGLLAVTIVVAVHVFCVFCVTLPLFLWSTTRISMLGNAWQVAGQLLHDKTLDIMMAAALEGDDVGEKMAKTPTGKKGKLQNRELVGLRASEDQATVEVFTSHEFSSGRSSASSGAQANGDRGAEMWYRHRSRPAQKEAQTHEQALEMNGEGDGTEMRDEQSSLLSSESRGQGSPVHRDQGQPAL